MTKILIGFIAAVVILYGIFSLSQESRIDALEKSKDRGKIAWHVEMAKAKGQKDVVIGASLVDYAVPRNLDEALAHHDLVLAEVLSNKSFSADTDITTWYKFRLIETFSTHTETCSICPSPAEAPSELLPLNEGEFLLQQLGGEVEIEGVKVVGRNTQFPAFDHGKKYLIFLSFDSNKLVASAPMGPWGTFISGPDEKIHPVDEKLIHNVRSEMASRFNDSLTSMRKHLKTNEREN